MRAAAIVEIEIAPDPIARRADAVVGVQIDLLVLHAAPEPLDEHIVSPGAFAVHADCDLVLRQHGGEGCARELRALVRVEDLGLTESGSGKSTLARCIVGLEQPDGGAILLEGTDIAGLSRARMRPYRKALQMVFQDPFASLNPRWRVGDIIAQGPIVNGTPRRIALEEARELLA